MNIFESQGRSGKSHRKGLAAAGGNDINTLSRRRRSGRPPGPRPAMVPMAGSRHRFLEGRGPSPPPVATTSTLFHGADGADALQRLGQQWRPWPAPATGFWRAAVPRSRRCNDISTISRRRRSGRPPGPPPAMVPMPGSRHRFLEGCGPSQPPVQRHQHHFTAPTERTPSTGSASNGDRHLALIKTTLLPIE